MYIIIKYWGFPKGHHSALNIPVTSAWPKQSSQLLKPLFLSITSKYEVGNKSK
jgi:hypothetical protein